MDKVESARRAQSPEENMKLFEALLCGEPAAQAYCMRAKIDMSSVNGTMRDPVLYRYRSFLSFPGLFLQIPLLTLPSVGSTTRPIIRQAQDTRHIPPMTSRAP